MARKRREAAPRGKKKGGLLVGMRGGFQSAVKGATGVGGGKAPSRGMSVFWNVVTVLLALFAGAMLLRRFGVISF